MKTNARIARVGAVLLYLLPAIGCSIFSVADGDQQSSLDQNRSQWDATGITDYTVRFQRTSTCIVCNTAILIPVRLTVTGDTIRAVFDLDNNVVVQDFVPNESPCLSQVVDGCRSFLTVDELFDFIQSAIDQDAVEIDISYNENLGYPVDIVVDFSRRFFDDETGFQIRDFSQTN